MVGKAEPASETLLAHVHGDGVRIFHVSLTGHRAAFQPTPIGTELRASRRRYHVTVLSPSRFHKGRTLHVAIFNAGLTVGSRRHAATRLNPTSIRSLFKDTRQNECFVCINKTKSLSSKTVNSLTEMSVVTRQSVLTVKRL